MENKPHTSQSQLSAYIEQFGKYKKVIHAETGLAYRVPTKDIITKGLKGSELHKYPLWKTNHT